MSTKEKKVVKDVKKFTVDRETWYRGKGDEKSCLANNANRMCCLGFYAEACGLDRKVIRNLASPNEAVRVANGEEVETIKSQSVTRNSKVLWDTKLVDSTTKNNATITNDLMAINDDEEMPDKERESRIRAKFKSIGIKVIFK